ncbi:MAG: aldo/keto reductase [Acidobacteriota bacterium]|nr:aldo/keto reductase [Acidobacteriota bacterium]
MDFDASRRKFLQAGLALPVAGLVASNPPESFGRASAGVVYRTLGKTGLRVSGVGCGVGLIPDPAVLVRAADLGVNYFDTARTYEKGKSEEITGAALKSRRNRILLASKTDGVTKAEVFREMDESLKALRTDHVDIWHLHAKDTPDSITDELVEAQETLKQQGKTRFIGISTHDINAVVDKVIKLGKHDVVQTTYSYPIGAGRNAALHRLQEAGIGVVAMKVVVALSMAGFAPPPKERRDLKGDGPLAAVKWVLRNPDISTTVPYMKNLAEVEMNFRAMAEPYTDQDEKMLFARNEEIRPLYCRMCYACKGKCPHGIPVTEELRYLAYNDFAGDFRQARDHFSRLPDKIRAVRCLDCSTCAIQCPNGVDVQNRLIRAQELLT